jgi:hypothetical protein
VRSHGWLTGGIPIWTCALALGLSATPARAEDLGNHLYDRFQGSVAGSLLWLGSSVRIDAKDGSIGTDLDVEDDLGFSNTKIQPRFEFRWRPGRRHELGIGYQFARRSASKTLEGTIDVGDTSFLAGAQIHSVFDTDNLFLTYRFAIMAHERTQLGVGLGLGAFFFKTEVDALAGVSAAGRTDSVTYSNSTSFVGPTAALGLYGRFRAGDRWYINPDVRYLRVKIDRFTAQVVEGGLAGQYFLSRKVGLEGGVAVRSVKVEVGPRTDGGGIVNLDVSAEIKYTETSFRLGAVFPL